MMASGTSEEITWSMWPIWNLLKICMKLKYTHIFLSFLSHASSSEHHECWSSQCSSQDSSLHIVATSVSASSKVIVRVTLLLSDMRFSLLWQTGGILRGHCSRHSKVTVSNSCVWNCSANNNTTWKRSSYITSVLVFWLPEHFSIGLKIHVKDIAELQDVAYWTLKSLLFGVFLTRPLVTPIGLMKSKEIYHLKVTHHGHVKWLHLLY